MASDFKSMKVNKTIICTIKLLSAILWVWRFPYLVLCFLGDFIEGEDLASCVIFSSIPILLWICGFLLAWLVMKRVPQELENISFLFFCTLIALLVIIPFLPRIEDFARKFEAGYEIFRRYGLLIYIFSQSFFFIGLGFLAGVSSKK
jgi:hypothetical protein